jgi:hypothetical protein
MNGMNPNLHLHIFMKLPLPTIVICPMLLFSFSAPVLASDFEPKAKEILPEQSSSDASKCPTLQVPSAKDWKDRGYDNSASLSALGREAYLKRDGKVEIRSRTILHKDYDISSFYSPLDIESEKFVYNEITTEEQVNRLLEAGLVGESSVAELMAGIKRGDTVKSKSRYYLFTAYVPHKSYEINDSAVRNCVFDDKSVSDLYEDGFVSRSTDGWVIVAFISVDSKFTQSKTDADIVASGKQFIKRLVNFGGNAGFDSESTENKYLKVVKVQALGQTLSLISQEELEDSVKFRELLKSIEPRHISYQFKPFCKIFNRDDLYKASGCRVKDEKILDLDEILDESKKPEQGEQFVKEQAVSVIGW